jgi:hypothetical protein
MFAYSYVSSTPTNVATGPHRLVRLTLAAGADAATAIVYDDTDGASDPVIKLTAVANTIAHADVDVLCHMGIRVATTGTSPIVSVTYQ